MNHQPWIAIIGATSGIAKATARSLAALGYNLAVVGRNLDALEDMASDLAIRHNIKVLAIGMDASDPDACEDCCRKVLQPAEIREALHGVILCYGVMPDQVQAANNHKSIIHTAWINFSSAIAILQSFANALETRPKAVIAAISSVAGERGRSSNYIYGATKAGLSTFMEGMCHSQRLRDTGLSVLTIHPGMVATPMTDGLVNPKSPLVAKPEQVGRLIARALHRAKDGTIYVPGYWKCIMMIIRLLPKPVFHRVNI